MESIKTIRELKGAAKKVESRCTDTDLFIAKALLFFIERFFEKPQRLKKTPSQWNLFAAKYAKQGKTFKEAAIAWRKLKLKKEQRK